MNKKGFTLIEILLVVIIIALIAGLTLPNLIGRGKDAKIKAARADIDGGLAAVLDLYELDNGSYPEKLEDLWVNPNNVRNWRGPYVKKKKAPLDPWGKPYIYRKGSGDNPYELFSAGPDGIENTDDDIKSWE